MIVSDLFVTLSCSRLLSGRTCFVLWAFLSTSLWTPLTGSRPDAPTAVLRWASCLTTAATPSPPVGFFPQCDIIARCCSESGALSTCWCVPAVFVVLGTSIAVQMGTNPDWMFFCCFAGMFMFYCAHWQTYVSGTLRFGMWVNQRCLFFFFSVVVWGIVFQEGVNLLQFVFDYSNSVLRRFIIFTASFCTDLTCFHTKA